MQLIDPEVRLEWRARMIQDPLERLRYLRKHADAQTETSPGWLSLWVRPRMRGAIGASVALGCVLIACAAVFPRQAPEIRAAILPPPVQLASSKIHGSETIWMVSHNGGVEAYSNGLRVETRMEVSNVPRGAYHVFPSSEPDLAHAHWKNQPSGIVYHTTESNLAPFVPDENRNLQRIGEGVLSFVQSRQSYHYVIDRFGRVFRIVNEASVAYHAGPSIWADEQNVYVNLNSAFLGIAFETQTTPGEDLPTATPAQIDASRVLTEMLRARYGIPASDCVTHAQVSVNPGNGIIGYHTDWADRFPFAELGLRDNYAEPPASLWAFGFDYDPAYMDSTGARLLPGLHLAEAKLAAQAARARLPLAKYKAILQKNYKEITAGARQGGPVKETAHENEHE